MSWSTVRRLNVHFLNTVNDSLNFSVSSFCLSSFLKQKLLRILMCSEYLCKINEMSTDLSIFEPYIVVNIRMATGRCKSSFHFFQDLESS